MSLLRKIRGVASIELAILLIPLLIMTFGMTELGRAFYYYNGLLKSSRDASRYLSMYSRGENHAQARCLAVYGNVACQGDPLVPGLTTDMVKINPETGVSTGKGALDLVTVSIEGFPFSTMTPVAVDDMLFGPIVSVMRQGAS